MTTLSGFFKEHKKAALAFSGGADSSFLLYEAVKNGADVCAYYVHAQFQPAFELEDAKRVVEYVHACKEAFDAPAGADAGSRQAEYSANATVRMKILEADVLANPKVQSNPENRCYYCKQTIFSAILEAAKQDGYTEIWDGTNASDDEGDRPGMRALKEMRVLSPLRICGLTKDEIRARSKEAGLFTWNKPAYACLATRIPAGVPITEEALRRTERAENALFQMGFSDFRVRTTAEGAALVQVRPEQEALLKKHSDKIREALSGMYQGVAFGRR